MSDRVGVTGGGDGVGNYEVIVSAFEMTPEQYEALFDRVAEAAHALDEQVTCSGGAHNGSGWTTEYAAQCSTGYVWPADDLDDARYMAQRQNEAPPGFHHVGCGPHRVVSRQVGPWEPLGTTAEEEK